MTKQLTPESDYGQYRCGEKNRNAKLTEEEATLIKLLLQLGFFQRIIAKVFGVSSDTISKINIGKTWRWAQ